jgi:hypothetical protein
MAVGVVPPTLPSLVRAVTDADGVTRGPFIDTISLPSGWERYTYRVDSARGDRIGAPGVEAIGIDESFRVVADEWLCEPGP